MSLNGGGADRCGESQGVWRVGPPFFLVVMRKGALHMREEVRKESFRKEDE